MGGVVAHEEGALVQDEAGVAAVASGGERDEFGQGGFVGIELDDGGADFAVVEPDAGDEAFIGKRDELGAADFYGEVAPGPLGVRWFGSAEEGGGLGRS